MWKQYFKFTFVFLCVLLAWFRFFRRQGSVFIPGALTLALAADYCFLFSRDYFMAVAFFCGVQTCYCLVLKGARGLLWFFLKGILGTAALWLLLSAAGVSLDPQSLVACFYFLCLMDNMAASAKRKNYWLLACLIFLLIGDIHVGVYNLHHYFPVGQYLWYQIWWELSTPLIWGFYLPGQLLQAIKMPEISHPRPRIKRPGRLFPF